MKASTAGSVALVSVLCVLCGAAAGPSRTAPEPGLLFHLSGSRGLVADYAANSRPAPNFAADVSVVPDGARGPGLRCADTQLLSYWAPGNVYAARGTLSFFWRSREPVGKTEFPIFRVAYADHSSWDMVWLRIDYNGKPGFDAFVTDASLARIRVSVPVPSFPRPDEWVHLALSWDETQGIRFFVNGRPAARVDTTAVLDAALDQFGPHSRVISPMQVQSAYNFVRGGDIDEVRIYDRMLADENVAALARGEAPGPVAPLVRDLGEPRWRDEWWWRHGWNRPGDVPPPVDAPAVRIRKVEIHDAYDLKRWWWKGTDGIRETTWPGVYNRSRLPGRNDYFQLPDWDCYSASGKSVTFSLPDEEWNHLEISGAAWGTVDLLPANAPTDTATVKAMFPRPRGQERTFHRLPAAVRGQRVRFTNVEQETPIGEFAAYHVDAGREPDGIGRLAYRLTALAEPDQPSVQAARDFIAGRFAPDERNLMVALPVGAPRTPRPASPPGLPIVHILVPSDLRESASGGRRAPFAYGWTNIAGGLDGIALDLPALRVQPTHGDLFPLNIQVKDPIWPLRALLDVSLSVRPGAAQTIWLDTRDRLLPNRKGLYLVISGAGPGFGPASLEGAELRLVFSPRARALREHVDDRFTQVRDNYAQIVEEHPNSRRLALYDRFETDLGDLLRVDPDHPRGREYWYDYNKEQPRPPVTLRAAPPGVPLWAFRQVEALRALKRFVRWYVDERQIDNGELGGGLSDDGDLTNWWPGTALMGVDPPELLRSLRTEMEAFYEQGLFTNGLSTIQTDELHSYEEGIQVLGQSLTLDYGNPRHLERAMETSLAAERITGINAAGHRHIRSSYFSGTKVAEDGVWGYSKPSSYLVMHPAMALVEFNGAPLVRKWLLELADGVLAHRKPDASGRHGLRTTIHFATDSDAASAPAVGNSGDRLFPLLWAAFRWTGNRKYLQPFLDAGARCLPAIPTDGLSALGLQAEWGEAVLGASAAPEPGRGRSAFRHFAWQLSGDVRYLEQLYTEQAQNSALREYINTEGSLWTDRVSVEHAELQRARLGGVAIERNAIYPGHAVSWSFARPGDEEQVAVLVREATPRRLRIAAWNLAPRPVHARMTAWGVEPGTWRLTHGTRTEASAGPLSGAASREVMLERTEGLDVVFEPGTVTVLELDLLKPGVPYWSRPDLGIGDEDVRSRPGALAVTVHSIGARDASPARLVLRDGGGREQASARIPALRAPNDLRPSTCTVALRLPAGTSAAGGTVRIETAWRVPEITRRNNEVTLPR